MDMIEIFQLLASGADEKMISQSAFASDPRALHLFEKISSDSFEADALVFLMHLNSCAGQKARFKHRLELRFHADEI